MVELGEMCVCRGVLTMESVVFVVCAGGEEGSWLREGPIEWCVVSRVRFGD